MLTPEQSKKIEQQLQEMSAGTESRNNYMKIIQ